MNNEPEPTPSKTPTVALALSGGGVRGAYQVGMLKGIADFIDQDFPCRVVTGVSAGAINAAVIASATGSFRHATQALEQAWLDLSIDQVFKTSVGSLSWSLARWLWMLTTGGVALSVRGLFDTEPLCQYLAKHIPMQHVDSNIETGRLRSLALSTTRYCTGDTVTFVHGTPDIAPWHRARRAAALVSRHPTRRWLLRRRQHPPRLAVGPGNSSRGRSHHCDLATLSGR